MNKEKALTRGYFKENKNGHSMVAESEMVNQTSQSFGLIQRGTCIIQSELRYSSCISTCKYP